MIDSTDIHMSDMFKFALCAAGAVCLATALGVYEILIRVYAGYTEQAGKLSYLLGALSSKKVWLLAALLFLLFLLLVYKRKETVSLSKYYLFPPDRR